MIELPHGFLDALFTLLMIFATISRSRQRAELLAAPIAPEGAAFQRMGGAY